MPRVHELVNEHLEFWRERHLCTVTTLRRDGSPHVVPMGVVVDPQDGVAWAITSGRSRKVANLRDGTDPRVAVCQVDGRRWSTIEGTAEVRDDPDSVAEAVRRYAATPSATAPPARTPNGSRSGSASPRRSGTSER